MDFYAAVATAEAAQDAEVPKGCKRIGTCIDGYGIYKRTTATQEEMRAAGLRFGNYQTRDSVDPRYSIEGWR